MSVMKYRIQKGQSYTVVSNKIINLLKDKCEVLGVYVYLSSLPPEWQFHKSELQKTLKIGINKLDNILSILSKLNLIKIIPHRDSKGRFVFFDMHVMDGESIPLESSTMKTMEVDKSSTMKTIAMETMPMENSTYKENINIYKENIERAPLNNEDFKSKEARAICHEKKLDIDKQLIKYKRYYEGKEISPSRFLNWLEREKPEIMPIIKNERSNTYASMRDYTQERLDREERERNQNGN